MLNQNLGIIERLLSPSPKFFKIIGNILAILALISFVIAQVNAEFPLPEWIVIVGDKSVWASGLLGKIITMLTVDYTAKMKKEALPNNFK
ncbi:MAG: hypothetical protein MUF12_00665 [Sediminibacterium sp.]|jgi:hypothetical protein|nr:hypothetical protein [Sediminibacterium sp.]